MKTAARFLVAVFAGLSAIASAADPSQSLYAGFYYEPDGSWHRADDGRIMPASGGVINSSMPDSAVVFVAGAPANSGLRVQHWFMFKVSDLGFDGPATGAQVEYLAPYSESLSVSWNGGNHRFNTSPVYVCARFYYMTNSVVFHAGADGVSGSTARIESQCYTNVYNLTSNGFSRTGYAFANWTNDAGVVYADGQTVSGSVLEITNNMQVVDLHAVWSPNTNGVSYALDGGSHGSSHPSSATYDVPFEVSDPTRTGYVFSGWKVTGGLYRSTGAAPQYSADGETWSSVSSDSMLCKGANGSTWFKNLNPTNGAAVALTAQWTPRTTAVHFWNNGANTGISDKNFTYGEKLKDIAPPSWNLGYRVFLGYYTEPNGQGARYWDPYGIPDASHPTWDVDADSFDLYAHYVDNDCHITYKANGGLGADVTVLFTNDMPIVLFDGSSFSRLGYELLGWDETSSAVDPKYTPGQQATFYATQGKTDITLYAIWKEYYYVSFDCNGATNETPMAVQKFAFGESKALIANEYGKVGYEFSGWATNGAAAAVQDISYADRQVVVNIAKSAGETNALFASWRPISYVAAFDASKHSAVAIAPSNCTYDVEFPLPVIPYGDGDLWKHVGWSNTLENVVYYTNEVSSVSNLCTTAGATNTLVAVWESMVGPLSEAMDIDNLAWGNVEDESHDECWKVVRDVGYGTDSCVAQTGLQSAKEFWEMSTSVTNSGTLTFWWKTSGGNASLNYYSTQGNRPSVVDTDYVGSTEWTKLSLYVEVLTGLGYNPYRTVSLSPASGNHSPAETIYIDRMTWTPDGSSAEPTEEDARDISGISFDGGVLSLSFKNADERFSYNLRGTNDLVAPLALWPVLWTTNGTGSITITPPSVPSAPQFFYYLETTAK